jgi:hypothetical protein
MEMAIQAVLSFFLRPSSITIHNDGNVPGQAFEINLLLQALHTSFFEGHEGTKILGGARFFS